MSEEEAKKPDEEKPAEKSADDKSSEETPPEENSDGKGEAEAPPDSPLEESKKVLDALKEQNKVMSANLKKAEKIAADMMLGGRAPAGKEKTEEELEIQQAKDLLKGTGFAEMLFPDEKKA